MKYNPNTTVLKKKYLVGISTKATSQESYEDTIAVTKAKYFDDNICETIMNRAKAGVTYYVYFQNDGNLEYFIGEAVNSLVNNSHLGNCIIPAGAYLEYNDVEDVAETWADIKNEKQTLHIKDNDYRFEIHNAQDDVSCYFYVGLNNA